MTATVTISPLVPNSNMIIAEIKTKIWSWSLIKTIWSNWGQFKPNMIGTYISHQHGCHSLHWLASMYHLGPTIKSQQTLQPHVNVKFQEHHHVELQHISPTSQSLDQKCALNPSTWISAWHHTPMACDGSSWLQYHHM